LTFNKIQYLLYQIHCHTGSEHTVDGAQYSGECHFVHRSNTDLYAVIGIFLVDSAKTRNPVFSELMDQVPTDDSWDIEILDIQWNPMLLLDGLNLAYYWSYSGSFTTPPCTESVQWFVLRDVLLVTSTQIKQIQNISGIDNNFRIPQRLSGRVILDGSDIITIKITWTVELCCMLEKSLNDTVTPVATVLDLPADNVHIISYSTDRGIDDRRRKTITEWKVVYGITIKDNTETFVEHLLKDMSDDSIKEVIDHLMNEDISGGTISKIESVSLQSDYKYTERESSSKKIDYGIIGVISCASFLCLVLIAGFVLHNWDKIKNSCCCGGHKDGGQHDEQSQLVSNPYESDTFQ
jgi:hypothetical protein